MSTIFMGNCSDTGWESAGNVLRNEVQQVFY